MSTMTHQRHAVVAGTVTSGLARTASTVLADAGFTLPAGSPLVGAAIAGIVLPPIATGPARRLDHQWATPAPIEIETAVWADSVITRVQAVPSAGAATVERHIWLRDESGTVREEGSEVWRLTDASAARVEPALDFCTPQWGDLLRESLSADPDFASALASWDGTIGLRCLDCGPNSIRELHLRIYRGQIIDVTRRTPGGATFTFEAPAHAWVDLMINGRNDFMRRAIKGEFSCTGNGYEYVRLTKPLNLIIAHGRAIAAPFARTDGTPA
jgi:hypothetical protein